MMLGLTALLDIKARSGVLQLHLRSLRHISVNGNNEILDTDSFFSSPIDDVRTYDKTMVPE